MKIKCEHCENFIVIPETEIPADGLRITCDSCDYAFILKDYSKNIQDKEKEVQNKKSEIKTNNDNLSSPIEPASPLKGFEKIRLKFWLVEKILISSAALLIFFLLFIGLLFVIYKPGYTFFHKKGINTKDRIFHVLSGKDFISRFALSEYNLGRKAYLSMDYNSIQESITYFKNSINEDDNFGDGIGALCESMIYLASITLNRELLSEGFRLYEKENKKLKKSIAAKRAYANYTATNYRWSKYFNGSIKESSGEKRELNKLDESLKEIRKIHFAEPRNFETFNLYGLILMNDPRMDKKSELLFLRSILLNPEYIDPYVNLSILFLLRDDFKRSIHFAEKAIGVNGENQRAIALREIIINKGIEKKIAEIKTSNKRKIEYKMTFSDNLLFEYIESYRASRRATGL